MQTMPLFNWPFRTYNGIVGLVGDQKQVPQFQPEYEPRPELAPF